VKFFGKNLLFLHQSRNAFSASALPYVKGMIRIGLTPPVTVSEMLGDPQNAQKVAAVLTFVIDLAPQFSHKKQAASSSHESPRINPSFASREVTSSGDIFVPQKPHVIFLISGSKTRLAAQFGQR
jgi:hypothetical protein